MEALLALSLLEIGRFELDPPAVKPALQRLEITNVPSCNVKQLAYNLKGFILNNIGSGFPSRLLYHAAGLALGPFRSVSTLLKACDVTFLVQHVQTSGTPTESSIRVLHACWCGHTDVAALLLQQNAVVDLKSNGGHTALHWACMEGHIDTARLLFLHHSVVDTMDGAGHTALHGACMEGHTDIGRLLLQHHAAVDTKNGVGHTALHCARRRGHSDAVRLLEQDPADSS